MDTAEKEGLAASPEPTESKRPSVNELFNQHRALEFGPDDEEDATANARYERQLAVFGQIVMTPARFLADVDLKCSLLDEELGENATEIRWRPLLASIRADVAILGEEMAAQRLELNQRRRPPVIFGPGEGIPARELVKRLQQESKAPAAAA